MARHRGGAKRWIQRAVKRPGALHRALKIPQGVKIPTATLHLAIEDPGWFVSGVKAQAHLRRMAQLALTFRGFKRRHRG